MLLNYVRLSIRVILRNRLFSLINILGLSLGFAAFFVLWQYVVKVLLSTTIRQIAIAVVIGIPAHFLAQEYLVKYSERITLQWWHYLAPVLALLLILFMTTASILRKAARTNPADSLRCE